ncbi:lysine 5,6-aminomutase subunit alpha [Peptoniphilus sp. KCTC 25270]|uniref:lysine 5,6-aminomutase subunit alpha n=1 Tax=Peptoniphilus sp. KCTC 25270 TaxID=2897414 RepID=UPI001E2A06B2|nr:lysine 5,6-aminomutase subunit alpha [Peptoniphilus sp. KCTC 25270]MCD1147630.1 lysine 5,6-aminomutase subunit alpha [Peptoniphilus sp. KCTC 25270]
MGKLNLDQSVIDKSRASARAIAEQVQEFIDTHTTVSTERAVLRLLGIDGQDDAEVPMPNVVVEQIHEAGELNKGISYWIGNAMIETGMKPQEIAEEVAAGTLNLVDLPRHDLSEIQNVVMSEAKERMKVVDNTVAKRNEYLETLGEGPRPYLYVIVATGNIYEDIVQAKAAALQGADIIAVIRTTGQSLLDFVPYSAPTGGFGGTYATQENFRLMRAALDEVGEKVGRYIRLCNYCSGLCMPEIAAMGAMERLDVMLNDALYGILFRDINMQRTLVDQYFSRVINGYAGVIINTGEDNYLTTADAVEEAHTVLSSQYMNEQFALMAALPEEQMGLGHCFEMDPDTTNGFLYELAQAQMARQIFPKAPLKYMPPTKFMTGNIMKGHVQDALFNAVSIMTHQGLQLLGMMTEAVHTPHLQDRYLAIENAQYVFNNMKDFGDDIEFKKGGIMETRANEVVEKAQVLLEEIEAEGIFKTIEEGKFGGVKRSRTGGKGLEGVVERAEEYFNPFIPLMTEGRELV